MTAFLGRRLLGSVATIWAVVTLAFAIIRIVPGDPARIWLADYATPELVAQLRQDWGLAKPLWYQYGLFIGRLSQGDLGRSFRTDQPVAPVLRSQYPYTLELTALSLLLAVAIGIPSGIEAGLSPNSGTSLAIMGGNIVGISMPGFWLALLLILLLGVKFPIFPFIGAGQEQGIASTVMHLALPALALGIREAAVVARMMRATMVGVLTQDYLRTARAKGLREHVVVYKHAMRNALLPVISIVGVDSTTLLGGAVVIEAVFGRPGVGSLMVGAIINRDYPMIQGSILFFALAVVLINLLTDLSYAAVDPRIR